MIRSHLARADRYIAEMRADIARERVILEHALDAGHPSAVAESMLHALEEPRRIREASRTGSRSVEAPTVRVRRIIQAPRPDRKAVRAKGAPTRRGATHQRAGT